MEPELIAKGSTGAKLELRAYASRLKADFERQKLSRAAGRHARYSQLRLLITCLVLITGPHDLGHTLGDLLVECAQHV